MSKKTIKAWAIYWDGDSWDPTLSVCATRKEAASLLIESGMKHTRTNARVIPCTITLSPKPAKGKNNA